MLINKLNSESYFLSDKNHLYSGWLFKYMSNLEYIKEAIRDKTIYLSNPVEFNDPFDCGFMITPNVIEKMSCKPSLIRALTYGYLKPEEKNKLNELITQGDKLQEIGKIIKAIIEDNDSNSLLMMIYMRFQMIEYIKTKKQPFVHFDSNLKVFCFSQTRKSFPMWAHYADNHKGACLEYDAREIIYSPENDVPEYALTTIQYTDQYITDDIENYERVFLKSNQWCYEKEVRIVCRMQDNKLKFPYLKKVILGVNMPQKNKDELISFCLDNGIDVYCAEVEIGGDYDLSIVQRGDILKAKRDRGI